LEAQTASFPNPLSRCLSKSHVSGHFLGDALSVETVLVKSQAVESLNRTQKESKLADACTVSSPSCVVHVVETLNAQVQDYQSHAD
jgi:hypothetical protein